MERTSPPAPADLTPGASPAPLRSGDYSPEGSPKGCSPALHRTQCGACVAKGSSDDGL
jgi:hypothetical protein